MNEKTLRTAVVWAMNHGFRVVRVVDEWCGVARLGTEDLRRIPWSVFEMLARKGTA